MSEAPELGREDLIRQARQHLEALARAGVDRIPRPRGTSPLASRPAAIATATPLPAAPEPSRVPPPSPTRTSPPPRPPITPPAASLFGEEEVSEPAIPEAERPARLEALRAEVAACTRCPLLAPTRTQTVFGEGSPTARLMFIGEAPGADEDRTGRPFIGKAGQLLTDMITKGMGLRREDVYIANILKSRPPNNRDPLPEEVANCLPFLERQIAIIRPEFLCFLGRVAAQTLLGTAMPMNRLRGRWHRYRGIPTVVTWHPAYLLRNPAAKKDAWEDLKMLMTAMGLKPPDRGRG